MSFCVYYDKDFEYTDEVQELRIVYRPKDRKNLQEFLTNYSTKHRIIIEITKIKDVSFEELAMIKLKHPDFNFTLTIDETFTKELMSLLDDTGLPYYFNSVISNIDQFNGLLQTNVTDILVGENLCFHADNLHKLAKKYNKKLRVFVNVVQSSWLDKENSITDFFIRPDDIDLYSNYFDVFEFWAEKNRQNVLYEIYQKDKYWYGNLEDLIAGFKGHSFNANLLSLFGEKRINCGKKCAYGIHCEWCKRINHLSQALQNQEVMIKHS